VTLADLHSPLYAIGLDICVFISFVVITIRSFPGSVFITGFVTGVTRRRPIMEQELLTRPPQLSLPHVIW
jgi:hypothetical protein